MCCARTKKIFHVIKVKPPTNNSVLIDHGAKVDIKNNSGEIAISKARKERVILS